MNENTSFKQYLNECGYDLMNYQEQVYNACLAHGDYTNIDLYYQDEIEKAFNNQEPVNEVAERLCVLFDEEFGKKPETIDDEIDNYENASQREFVDQYDFSNDFMGESTENKTEDDGLSDGETYDQWKEYVFKYLDKRVDVDKIKELGTYIKDFIKQEYDNGEPSWFACAESIVNYARIKYPDALKPRESNAFSITENVTNEAFMDNDKGKVSVTDLVNKIMDKAGLVVDMDDDYTAAAYYIADFYSKQSLPINGMVMWGSRDLLKFKRLYDEQIKNANTSEEIQEYEKRAVTNVRSIMLGNPGKKWVWIEEIKDEVRKERKAAEEKRRQDYLNSEEHRHMNDPGWRGPRGTWSND